MPAPAKSQEAAIYRLSVSAIKGEKKRNVGKVRVTLAGITGDAHAGTERAISLLPYESFKKLSDKNFELNPGEFGENITTLGIDFKNITPGIRLALGEKVVLEIIQIGKECHDDCFIKRTVGDCIMPREGLFARVIIGGPLAEGDRIRILK